MTRRHEIPFSERLASARRLLAHGLPAAPADHLADQLDAAGREKRRVHDRLGMVLPVVQPDRRWRQRMDPVASDETRAYLLAALIGCTTVCVHLRRGGPRPAFARLPLRRVDCGRCVATLRPAVTEADECDVCGGRGVTTFHLFAVRQGPVLLAGDACPDCAGVPGIRFEEATACMAPTWS